MAWGEHTVECLTWGDGDELLSFLNHKRSNLDAVRQPYTNFIIKDYFKRAYEEIITRIWNIDNNTHIIVHGYGHGIPDGRGVIRFLGFSFVGPWLRPALTAKGYVGLQERERITRDLIDILNDMLIELAGDDGRGRIHYIDLRRLIKRRDWENELHLHNSAFKRVAGRFDNELRTIPIRRR